MNHWPTCDPVLAMVFSFANHTLAAAPPLQGILFLAKGDKPVHQPGPDPTACPVPTSSSLAPLRPGERNIDLLTTATAIAVLSPRSQTSSDIVPRDAPCLT